MIYQLTDDTRAAHAEGFLAGLRLCRELTLRWGQPPSEEWILKAAGRQPEPPVGPSREGGTTDV